MALVLVRVAIAAFGLHGSPLSKAQKIQDTPSVDWATEWTFPFRKAGGAAVVWRDFRAGETDPDIYAQFVDNNGRKQWPNELSPTGDGIPLCTRIGVQRNPLVAISSDNRATAWFGWIDERDGSPRIFCNARVLNVEDAGAKVPNGERVCMDEHEQRSFDLIGERWPAVGAIVVWADKRDDAKDFDIYAQRLKVTAQGIERVWGENGKVVCSENGKQARPRVVCVSSNPALYVVVWEDERNGANDRDLYAQKLDDSGERKWVVAGKVVCVEARNQHYFDLAASFEKNVPDGSAVVAWQDHRDAAPDTLVVDIYGQKLNRDGDPAWPAAQPLADGVAVCTAAGAQLRPKVASDGGGGEYVVWLDKRANPAKLYRQRVDNGGAPKWMANGFDGTAAPATEERIGYSVNRANRQWKSGLCDLAVSATVSGGNTGVDVLCDLFGANDGKKMNALTLSKALLDQYQPVAVVIGNGLDIMAAWRDDGKAEAEADIYATFGTFKIGKEPQPEQQRAPLVTGATPPLPDRVMLLPNHPNPFSTTTSFRVGLPHASDLSIDVFDVAGRRVSGRRLSAPSGWQDVVFDGRSETGPPLPSGVYFCRVNANGQTATRKFVIQR